MERPETSCSKCTLSSCSGGCIRWQDYTKELELHQANYIRIVEDRINNQAEWITQLKNENQELKKQLKSTLPLTR